MFDSNWTSTFQTRPLSHFSLSYNLTSDDLWPWYDLWPHQRMRVPMLHLWPNFGWNPSKHVEVRTNCWPVFTTYNSAKSDPYVSFLLRLVTQKTNKQKNKNARGEKKTFLFKFWLHLSTILHQTEPYFMFEIPNSDQNVVFREQFLASVENVRFGSLKKKGNRYNKGNKEKWYLPKKTCNTAHVSFGLGHIVMWMQQLSICILVVLLQMYSSFFSFFFFFLYCSRFLISFVKFELPRL